ncbi:MAG: carboxymuconolactone decarboxylase family protein [Dehalococcoidaceae bacterium]|nr:carboxymuconolactone decarboxylase family protein [Dehalococcoidaceae bacterium]
MRGFQKRTYGSIQELLKDMLFPFRNRKKLREVRTRKLISSAFRERLMLAVTAVNGCRYCSYFHARQALKSGVGSAEIHRLLSGIVENSPEDELLAIIYAQHWAETNANPDPEAVIRLEQAYGKEGSEAINLMLRMIRMGNLMGNSWDYFLSRVSFGKWGIQSEPDSFLNH